MNVEYANHMGDDLMVANAARVSFAKHKSAEEADWSDEPGSDKRLINYLASHGHWTPFGHPQITVRVKAPIFVARQLYKHKVGFTENEVSRRYVDDAPDFFLPSEWRGRPTNGAKQGSSDEVIKMMHFKGVAESWKGDVNNFVTNHYDASMRLYNSMIEAGIAPEQARMILPQSMYTEWYLTGSLSAFARLCKQRMDSHAQSETREIAVMIDNIVGNLYPVSWEALTQ